MADTPPVAPSLTPQSAEPAPTTFTQQLGWPGMLAAVVLIGFFFVLTWTMFFDRLTLEDIYWSRAMQIYSGIEAFALAAAGALLGTQIQARNVAAAERRAEKKDKEAIIAKDQAAKSKSELGGYRRAVAAARRQVDLIESTPERGGGDADGKARDLAVLRGILIAVED